MKLLMMFCSSKFSTLKTESKNVLFLEEKNHFSEIAKVKIHEAGPIRKIETFCNGPMLPCLTSQSLYYPFGD